MVQFILSPVAGSDRSRICRIWCDSSYSAFTPSSGAEPACEALPLTFSVTAAMPAVASDSLSVDAGAFVATARRRARRRAGDHRCASPAS